MKVLFVQSKPMLATALHLTFLSQGFEVIFCNSAFSAVENIVKHDPKLVILDMMVPSIGVEFVSAIKKFNLPIIVMSAFGSEEQLQKAFDNGADDYVNMPFSMSELVLRTNLLTRFKGKATA
jgi:DNA-binding response OmpR family regulator